MKKLPNFNIDFMGIGMPRCGTTWISKCLSEHPDICFSEPKEPHFFDISWRQGSDIELYEKYFKECSASSIRGEFTTTYYENNSVLENIVKHFPDIKIIISLRNPIDRAFSQYLYRKRKSGAHKNFSRVIDNDEAKIISTSLYYKHIKRIVKIIPIENILFTIHEDVKKDPLGFIQNIYKFLGVQNNFQPVSLLLNTNRTKNLRYRIPWIRWVTSGQRFKIKKSKFGRWIIFVLKIVYAHRLVQFIESLNTKQGEHVEDEFVAEEERTRLNNFYKEDIQLLESLIQRDLKMWYM